MTNHMDHLYKSIDTSLENQARQYALNRMICDHVVGKNVIEVGCGSGTLLKLLLQKKYNVEGCDISKTQVNLAKKRISKAGFSPHIVKHASLEKINDWKRQFDTVICIDVLEHIKDDKKAIHHLAHLLKPRGTLIILVPAFPILWSERDKKYGHFRRYTKKQIKKLFLHTRLAIETCRYWNFITAGFAIVAFRFGLDKISDSLATTNTQPLKTVNAFVKKWLMYTERHIAFPFGMSLLVVAKKKNT